MAMYNYPMYVNDLTNNPYLEQEERLLRQREKDEKAKAFATMQDIARQLALRHQISKAVDAPQKQSNKKLLLLTT